MADIGDAMMREQSRARHAFWLYICQHKELPPRDSTIMRHLARASACDPPDVQHIGLCEKGVDLVFHAISNHPDAPTLADAVAAFEIWLCAKDVHRATFVSNFEFYEALRRHRRKQNVVTIPDTDDPVELERRTRRRVVAALYIRHRYKPAGAR